MRLRVLSVSVAITTLLLLTTASLIRADNTPRLSDGLTTSSLTNPWTPSQYHFTYSNGTATCTSCHFTIDPITGIITDYTIRLTRYPQVLFQPIPLPDKTNKIIQSHEHSNTTNDHTHQTPTTEIVNATIYTTIAIDDFSIIGDPAPYSTFLTIHGTNALMMFYDQEGGSASIYGGPDSIRITFTVPEGTNITNEPSSYDIFNEKNTNAWASQPNSYWQTIQLSTGDIHSSITAYNGNITSTGQTIKITLNPYGSLSTYSWVQYPAPKDVSDYWYKDLNITKDKTVIEDAKDTGIIPAEGWCTNATTVNVTKPGTGMVIHIPSNAPTANSNCYRYNDPSFNMTFNTIEKNKVDVLVDSEIPTGRIVIINLQRNVLNTTSINDLLVSIDSAGVPAVASLEDLMTKVEDKDTTGAYYALMGEHLVSVFVYIPHFSTHTISIESLVSPIPMLTSGIVPIVLSVAFLSAIVVGLVLQRRKPFE